MSWNYRVLRHSHKSMHGDEHYYSIHEVYYEKDGSIHAWSANPVSVGGETFAEIHAELDRMRNALNRPVLTESSDGKTLVELP